MIAEVDFGIVIDFMKGWIIDGLMFDRLNCDDMSSCWISGCIIEVCKFEFNFKWNEGYDKVY